MEIKRKTVLNTFQNYQENQKTIRYKTEIFTNTYFFVVIRKLILITYLKFSKIF